MVLHQVNSSGICSTCNVEANEPEVLQCYDCKSFYHGVCGDQVPYGSKTFLSLFKKLKVGNIIFVCDICITKRENHEASSINDQIAALTMTVNTLANEFKSFKAEKEIPLALNNAAVNQDKNVKPWSNLEGVQNMKSSLCIKSNGVPVNMGKVQELAANNSIQESKTVVKENGDVYVDLLTK